MSDRRQGDRREQTASTKKIQIPFMTFIFSIVLIIIIALTAIICVELNKVGYNKGYEDGYEEGIQDAYYMSLLDNLEDYSIDIDESDAE